MKVEEVGAPGADLFFQIEDPPIEGPPALVPQGHQAVESLFESLSPADVDIVRDPEGPVSGPAEDFRQGRHLFGDAVELDAGVAPDHIHPGHEAHDDAVLEGIQAREDRGCGRGGPGGSRIGLFEQDSPGRQLGEERRGLFGIAVEGKVIRPKGVDDHQDDVGPRGGLMQQQTGGEQDRGQGCRCEDDRLELHSIPGRSYAQKVRPVNRSRLALGPSY